MIESSYFWKKYHTEPVELVLNEKNLTGKLEIVTDINYDVVDFKLILGKKTALGVFEYLNHDQEHVQIKLSLINHPHQIIMLYRCRQLNNCIFPEYALIGNTNSQLPNKFDLIYLYLNGLSHGFWSPMSDDESPNVLKNECKLKIDTNYCSFDVDLDNGVNIKTYWKIQSSSKEQCNDQQSIKFDMQYVVKLRLDKFYSLNDLLSHIERIKASFSLLMLDPLTIDYIEIGCEVEKHLPKQIPFFIRGQLYDETEEPQKSRRHKTLIQLQVIDACLWKKIFEGAYSNDKFLKLWTRFISGLSYHGFWEYRFLIFVSLYERYLKVNYTGNSEELLIDSKNKPSLKRCFELFIRKFPENLLKIIKFDNKIHKKLIDIRNAIAHNDYDIIDKIGGEEFDELLIALNKLIILMACISYVDLGFDTKDIAKHFSGSMNPILLEADRDRVLINEINGNPALVINEDDYQFVSDVKNYFIILEKNFTENSGEEYCVNRENTYKVNNIMFDNKQKNQTKNVEKITKSYYCENHDIKWFSAYLKCKNETAYKNSQGMIVTKNNQNNLICKC